MADVLQRGRRVTHQLFLADYASQVAESRIWDGLWVKENVAQ